MLASISPLGKRAHAFRWWLTVAAYLLGSVVGGATLGLVSGALGAFVPASWRWSALAATLVAALLFVGLLLDLRVAGRRLPSWVRQVDEAWLTRYRGWVYGLGFGAQLGFGMVTIVTSSTVYATVLLCALSGSPRLGLLMGTAFGAVRGIPVLLTARVRQRDDLHRLFRGLDRWARPVDRLAKATLGGAGVAFAVVATLDLLGTAWGPR